MTSIEKYVRRLDRVERELRAVSTQPRLRYSSIDNGSLELKDVYGNVAGYIGMQFDGTTTSAAVGGTWPTSPTMPMVTPVEAGLRIYWDGTYSDGSATRMDFRRVTFHAVTDVDDLDVLDPGQIVGEITTATGGEISVYLPMGVEHFVFAVAWTEAGKFSVESDPAFGTPLFVVGQEVLDELNANLDNLNDVALPALETALGSNTTLLDNLTTITLPGLETELGANTDAITNLRDVTLPGLETELGANTTLLDNLITVTLPGLETELGANTDAITNLRDVTLPALQEVSDLTYEDLQDLRTVTLPVLISDISDHGDALDTLQTITLPTLQGELDAADLRLTGATASIVLDLSDLTTEVATLTSNTNTGLGSVSSLVSIINGATRSRHGIY